MIIDPDKELIEIKQKEIDSLKRELQGFKIDHHRKRIFNGGTIESIVNDLYVSFSENNYETFLNKTRNLYDVISLDRSIVINDDPEKSVHDTVNNLESYIFDERYGIKDFEGKDIPITKANVLMVGAQPGAGKTTFGVNILIDSVERKEPTVFLSSEMPEGHLWIRYVQQKIMKETRRALGFFTMNEIIKRQDSFFMPLVQEYLKEARKYVKIVNTSGCTAKQLVSVYDSVRETFKGQEIDKVIYDYIQITRAEKDDRTNKDMIDNAMLEIVLKAKTTNSLWIVLSQLNRDSQKADKDGKKKKPTMQDLKESGALEQDSAVIFILEKERDWQGKYKEETTLHIVKNRYGTLATIELLTNNRTGYILSKKET